MQFKSIVGALAVVIAATTFSTVKTEACTRVLYVGDSALQIVGRSLDWKTPIPTNLYVYPRGMEKEGSSQAGAVKWCSLYGAVYAVGYDGGVTEGMNEKGLVINGLFCKGAVYSNDTTVSRPPISLSMFVAWLLDMHATTPEVVATLRKHDFNIVGATFDNGTTSSLHWGITDRNGDCAVVEFNDGNISIYEGRYMQVLTNDPGWKAMNSINDYWEAVGGGNMLPGTVKSADRFVRAMYFINHVITTGDAEKAVPICRSVLMNCSVPYTYTVEGEGNVSSTQWRSLADQRGLCYYFDIVTNNSMYYIDLNKCNLKKGAAVLKLDTSKSAKYTGDVTSKMVKSLPFTPIF